MSSTYRILCLSHDPATAIGEHHAPGDAEHAISVGIDGHANCDLAIGSYSYPLTEVGCPSSGEQPASLGCRHGNTKWMDKEWLLLLTAAYQSDDPAIREAVQAAGHSCWPWERLRRMRAELGVTVATAAPRPDIACPVYQPPATPADSGLCARCGMFDYRHQAPADA